MSRKPVAMHSVPAGKEEKGIPIVVCDDGTSWYYDWKDEVWRKMGIVPGTEAAQAPADEVP